MEDLKVIDIEKFIADTRISELDLQKAFLEQSSLRAYYGHKAAQLEAYASKAKMVFECREANLAKRIRKEFAEQGVKVTEKMVDEAVKTSPEWIKAKNAVFVAQAHADVAKACVSSLIDRRDMLIQLGADRRDETKGQLRMMEIQNDNDRISSIRNLAKKIVPSPT